MGICIIQWRAAVGRWANFCCSRSQNLHDVVLIKGYWGFTLLKILFLAVFRGNASFTLVIMAILLIVSGTVHLNPGPEINKKMLKIGHVNMRSLCPSSSNKMEDLYSTLCTNQQCDVIAVSETWLNGNISDKQIEMPDHQVFRKDRDRNGGGVALYINNSISAKHLTDFDDLGIEVVAVEIRLCNRNVIILCCYRPPTKLKQDVDTFFIKF